MRKRGKRPTNQAESKASGRTRFKGSSHSAVRTRRAHYARHDLPADAARDPPLPRGEPHPPAEPDQSPSPERKHVRADACCIRNNPCRHSNHGETTAIDHQRPSAGTSPKASPNRPRQPSASMACNLPDRRPTVQTPPSRSPARKRPSTESGGPTLRLREP